jgi:PAS domain S-box-containing protein
VESPVSKVLEKGMIVGLANHSILVRKDGSTIPLDDSGAPIKDQNGSVTGVVLVFHDISERKKAQEATEKQAELINLSPDAIIVWKLDGTINFWSEGAEKLYGWTKDEAIGQITPNLLKSEFPQPIDEILDKIKKEGKWSGEIVHTCKDGSKLVVQSYWLAKFGSDGKIIEMLESNVDITQRMEMQLKLEESAVRLEEYANQMEALANQRAEKLKDAERLAAIGATAGMVGHDIRNPLQAITGDVYLAKTELASTADTEEKKNALESLDEIEKNIFYINKIVADLQDYARPLMPIAKETNLRLLINELITKNGIPKKVKVQIKVQKDSDIILADSDILRRILGNLVTNAVQAMPEGGKLSIQTCKEGGNSVITVADTGVGIPKEAKEKLFTPLFTTKSKGQGFGLAVVKRMTEALGGTVTFESEEGKGTKFILRLPTPNKNSR